LIPSRGKRFFLHSTVSRPVLGPTQKESNGLQGIFPWGVKLLEPEADHSPHLVPRLRTVELHLHSLETSLYPFQIETAIPRNPSNSDPFSSLS
jgi:hypothetical protein